VVAADEQLSLREVALRFATPKGTFVGTPEQVADKLEHWLTVRASDGFVLSESLPGQFERFAETVIPILQRRGLFRQDYEGSTFRSSLGLDVPQNRHTEARRRRSVA
jgi:alkanesulfonate monooxygenase SsuD/methylene tetrahydromethanopterin reductase-like flavin-dependent oxidoreductase (luciferase family)